MLSAAVRPRRIEAASVDHQLREGSRAEAEMVAGLCATLGVPHAILSVRWDELPESAIQEQSRTRRYALLSGWARERALDALCTAHHLDDQAETLMMRLARGAGVRGLAGIRPVSRTPDGTPLLRPLLGWRRAELEAICVAAGVKPALDPSNSDARFERVRVRRALAAADGPDPARLARSADHLAEADRALDWAVEQEWKRGIDERPGDIRYRPGDAPGEIRRRLIARAIRALGSEGECGELRGRELDSLLAGLEAGESRTLRGVLCSGGDIWRFRAAPPRRPTSA